MLTTFLGLLATALMTVPAAGQGQTTTVHITFLSHLSPLLEYTPTRPTGNAEQGWDVSLARHATDHSDSSFRWYGFANAFEIRGNASNVEINSTFKERETTTQMTRLSPRQIY
jgi:hypothetical protein